MDGEPGSRFDQIRDVDFDNSATILAEAIKALVVSNQVEANDIAGETISSAVDTVIAKNLWDEKGACAEFACRSQAYRQGGSRGARLNELCPQEFRNRGVQVGPRNASRPSSHASQNHRSYNILTLTVIVGDSSIVRAFVVG